MAKLYRELFFLHLSDLHVDESERGATLNPILGFALPDSMVDPTTQGLLKRFKTVDGIILSGDLTQSAKGPQYDNLSLWLNSISERLRTVTQQSSTIPIYCVPGNHDVHWPVLETNEELEKARQSVRKASTHKEFQAYWDNLNLRQDVLDPLQNYLRFADRKPKSIEEIKKPSDVPWVAKFLLKLGPINSGTQTLSDEDYPLTLLGLNSVLVSHSEDFGRLILGDYQLNHYRSAQSNNSEFVAVVHHPMSWLKDCIHVTPLMHAHARVVITGHEHFAQRELVSVDNMYHQFRHGSYPQAYHQVRIAAGAASSNDMVELSYNWIALHLDKNTQTGLVTLFVEIFTNLRSQASLYAQAEDKMSPSSATSREAFDGLQKKDPEFRPVRPMLFAVDCPRFRSLPATGSPGRKTVIVKVDGEPEQVLKDQFIIKHIVQLMPSAHISAITKGSTKICLSAKIEDLDQFVAHMKKEGNMSISDANASDYLAIGQNFQKAGRYTEASGFFQLACDHATDAQTQNDSLNALASVYISQGRYSEAELLLNRAITLVADDCATLIRMGKLNQIFAKYELAKERFEQVQKQCPKATKLDELRALEGLGDCYYYSDNLESSVGCYREALNKAGELSSSEISIERDVPFLKSKIGRALHRKGDYKEAYGCLNDSYSEGQKGLGEEHPGLAVIMLNLSEFKRQVMTHFAESEQLLQRALRIRQLGIGANHVDIICAYLINDLGSLHFRLKEFDQGKQYYEWAIESKIKLLGEQHPDVAYSYDRLASLLFEMNPQEVETANAYLAKAHKIWEAVFPQGHRDIVLSYVERGLSSLRSHSIFAEEKVERSNSWLKQAERAYEKLGSQSPRLELRLDILNSELWLVRADIENTKEEHINKARKICEAQKEKLGRSNQMVSLDMAEVCDVLGRCHFKLDERQQAIGYFEDAKRALQCVRINEGDKNLLISQVEYNLVFLREENVEEARKKLKEIYESLSGREVNQRCLSSINETGLLQLAV